MSEKRPRAKHDEAYKLLFSSSALVEGLLSSTVPGILKLIDRESLRKVSASFVKPEVLEQRHSDTVWRTRLLKPDGHPLFLPLEFQSAPEANMAFRIREYASLVLQEAEAQKDLGAGGRPPIVAPFVIYNGTAAWNAATDLAAWIVPDPAPALETLLGLQMRRRYILVALKDLKPEPWESPTDNWFSVLARWEKARSKRDADRLTRLWVTVLTWGDEGIIRGFGALRQQLRAQMETPDFKRMAVMSPERRRKMIRHEETLMAANLRELYEELRREGRQEGRREGRQEGRREGRQEGRQEGRLEGRREGRQEGHQEGRREGVQEGRRSVLRQLALQKFGPEVAGELSRLFDELTDADRFEALGSAIIECETGAEFLARATEA